ncbi:LysR substrate-binding domain-containing protein [Alkalilacustris brevis]|uniref:LysR substrate-binding domain-containing protein n=1 Tax=Alkalilacustris brevis TaxID=2026338 RepID=UPI000E0D5574|nr:LysR substrate-binding domain-containing protein [Alkalilacustris brevis]
MPTLQQMRYLAALAETLHFRRAAELAHVTQPTLSTQLRELELRLGVQLVERSRSRVILTPVGEEIARRARAVLRDVEEIRAVARFARQPLHGTMKVGVVQTLGSYLLPLIVPDLHRSHPELGFYVREGLPEALLGRLEQGGLELLFCALPVNRADLVATPLFHEPLMLVAPEEHPLARHEVVDASALKDQTILTLEPGHRMHDQIGDFCRDVGARISPDYEGTSLDTLRQMVAMGMGLSLLPALYVRSEVARERLVVARPLRAPAPARQIGMVWRKGSARAGEFSDLAGIIRDILRTRAPEISVPEDEAAA